LFKIKACEKNNHRLMFIKFRGLFFEHNADIEQKDY
jgi:hypothetical protein